MFISIFPGDVILVPSPAVPPHAFGSVISTCNQRGFALQGIKQLRLSPEQAFFLNVAEDQVKDRRKVPESQLGSG